MKRRPKGRHVIVMSFLLSRWASVASLMAAISIVVVMVCGAAFSRRPQWIQDSYGPIVSDHAVSDIFFLDALRGAMIVEDHTAQKSFLFTTRDGGESWTKRDAPNGITRLFFYNADLAWALRREKKSPSDEFPYLLRTTDGGKNWHSTPLNRDGEPESAPLDLAFVDPQSGWIVGGGDGGSCLVQRTSDGGKTVHPLPSPSTLIDRCKGVLAGRNAEVWIYGASILHSSNKGQSWERAIDLEQMGMHRMLFDISSATFLSSGPGLFVGQDEDAIILRTDDLGRHWSAALKSEAVGNFSAISFLDDRQGCAVSFYPVLLFCTDDAGLTWKTRGVLPPTSKANADFFAKLLMLKSGRGWAVRGGGDLYETSDGGHTWRSRDPLEH
jgi:photosystem II stability/assembly factor-like uncharacterized protein